MMDSRTQEFSPSARAAAVGERLVMNLNACAVTQALGKAGIRSIVLKGVTIADWLYEETYDRTFADLDLLVSGTDADRTDQVLSDLGYMRPPDPPEGGKDWYVREWHRPGTRERVDLHRTLIGIGVPPEEAWRVLTVDTTKIDVGSCTFEALGTTARALHIVLHAAQHGPRVKKPQTDLRLLITKFSAQEWRDVHSLAVRLQATPSFEAGLRLVEGGSIIADDLGLNQQMPPEVILRATSVEDLAASYAVRLQTFFQTPGVGRKLAFLVKEVVPPPSFVRVWYPPAAFSRMSLIMGYVKRPFWLARYLVPGLRALIAARRARRSY